MKSLDVFSRKVLPRYGQEVTVTRKDGSQERGRAIIQPLLEKTRGREQEIFTPLGVKSDDHFLYLGDPELSLDLTDYVTSGGRDYTVRQAHPIWVREICTHWWGILTRREEGRK